MEIFLRVMKISSGLLTSVVAVIVVYIAYQQWQTNKNRLKFELYNKRYGVYKSLQEILSRVLHVGPIQLSEIFKYQGELLEAEFLFDREVQDYVSMCIGKLYKLHSAEKCPSEEREILEWFDHQLYEKEMSAKFNKYLNVANL